MERMVASLQLRSDFSQDPFQQGEAHALLLQPEPEVELIFLAPEHKAARGCAHRTAQLVSNKNLTSHFWIVASFDFYEEG